MLPENFLEDLLESIFKIYMCSNISFKNTLDDFNENNKIEIYYDKFSNNESIPIDINIKLQIIHIQTAFILTNMEREIKNRLINVGTNFVVNYSSNNIKPSLFLDSKEYLEDYFSEKDIIIENDAIVYFCTFLQK